MKIQWQQWHFWAIIGGALLVALSSFTVLLKFAGMMLLFAVPLWAFWSTAKGHIK